MNPSTGKFNYPTGYVRKYNASGQAVDIKNNYPSYATNKSEFENITHFNIKID